MHYELVNCFDFDGTLTTRDTLLSLIAFSRGRSGLLRCLLRYSPQLVLMKLGLYANWRVKELVFGHCFGGLPIQEFEAICRQYAHSHRHLLRPAAMNYIEKVLAEGSQVLVVSASMETWVRPFFTDERIKVTGTRPEVADGRLTGRLDGRNCYGEEKVERIRQLYPDRTAYTLIAFGDSRGDREMLSYADEAHYQPFR